MISSKDKNYFGLNHVTINKADIFETDVLANLLKESDVVISVYAPPHDNTDLIVAASKSLVEAAKKSEYTINCRWWGR